MTILSERQKDALIEVINIAFARTGAALSELTGHRVLLNVPRISMHPIEELQSSLDELLGEEVATVHQIFSGPVSGDAILLLNHEGAVNLIDLLTEGTAKKERLYESDREVLNEVGNILLNACLGTFGNMLKVHITFTVPRVRLETTSDIVDTLQIGDQEVQYALIVSADFRVRESDVEGYLVIMLGVSSLDLLLQSLEGLG